MSELQHHGIIGMKWGIRRYQNRDGSLTEAGRRRYLADAGEGKNRIVTAYNKQRDLGMTSDVSERTEKKIHKAIYEGTINEKKAYDQAKEAYNKYIEKYKNSSSLMKFFRIRKLSDVDAEYISAMEEFMTSIYATTNQVLSDVPKREIDAAAIYIAELMRSSIDELNTF